MAVSSKFTAKDFLDWQVKSERNEQNERELLAGLKNSREPRLRKPANLS